MSGAFSVWAPHASTLEVEDLDGEGGPRLVRLERGDDGRWTSDHVPVGRYWIVLDGERFPDPAARAQPEGFDGPSDGAHPPAFPWTDRTWSGVELGDAVLYELHVGTFSTEGTFDGVIAHLDHLVDLGIDAVELMPVHTFPGDRGWGYDGVLLGAPHPAYGGPAGLRRLVDACHHRGIGVILDVVYNHLGPLGNHLARFGPFFDEHRHTPWGPAVNLDGPGRDGVRRFIVDDAVRWVDEYHLDGLRLDAVHAFEDRSAVHLVEELATAVRAVGTARGRRTWVIAESDLNDPKVVRPVDAGGWGADAAWSDDFHHALHAALTGERDRYLADFGTVGALGATLTNVFVHDGSYSAFRQRRHGRPVGGVDRHRFIGYTQNHDQVGNRALGERMVDLVGTDRARVAAALLLTAPFVPMLFQGEEWAASAPFLYFTSYPDEALGRAVRDGRRAEHAATVDPERVPDPQAASTFVRSRLDWTEATHGDHAAILGWYRSLVHLRRVEPDLRRGGEHDTAVLIDEDARWLRMRRGRVLVAANLGERTACVPDDGADMVWLVSRPGIVHHEGCWSLPPWSVVIAASP